MRAELDGPEPPHDHRREGEEGHLETELGARRRPDAHDPPQPRHLRTSAHPRQRTRLRTGGHVEEHRDEHGPPDDRGGPSASDHTHRLDQPLDAVDQRAVANEVHPQADEGDHHGGLGDAHPLEELPEREEKQEREHPPRERPHVPTDEMGDARILTQAQASGSPTRFTAIIGTLRMIASQSP